MNDDKAKIAEVKPPTHVQIDFTQWNEIMQAIAERVFYVTAAPILQKMQDNGKQVTLDD